MRFFGNFQNTMESGGAMEILEIKWKNNRGHLPPSLQGAPATTQVIRCPLWAYSHDPHSHLPTRASFDPQFYRRKKDCWNRHEWIRLTRWLSLVAFAEHF